MCKKNISGMISGCLTVIKEDGKIGKNNDTAWLCLCECGKEVRRRTSDLTTCKRKKCSCNKIIIPKDLINCRFGKLLVINELSQKNNIKHYNCLCDCGKNKILTRHRLLSWKNPHCGCDTRTRKRLRREDLSGMSFGLLQIIDQAKHIGKNVAWNCRCKCGNTTIVKAVYLKSGDTKSCGCLQKENCRQLGYRDRTKNKIKTLNNAISDMVGRRSGLLVIEKFFKIDKWQKRMWVCRCDCGQTTIVYDSHFKMGDRISCGCLNNGPWKGYGEIPKKYFSSLKKGAESRNFIFDVSMEYLWELYILQNGKCALSGVDIIFSRLKEKVLGTASLDRIDSRIGYIIGNVQWVHKYCNKMKQNIHQKDFIGICVLIAKNFDDKYIIPDELKLDIDDLKQKTNRRTISQNKKVKKNENNVNNLDSNNDIPRNIRRYSS